MKSANEIKAITDTAKETIVRNQKNYVVALCNNICAYIEDKIAPNGKSKHTVAIKNTELAKDVADYFEKFGFTVDIIMEQHTNLINISW